MLVCCMHGCTILEGMQLQLLPGGHGVQAGLRAGNFEFGIGRVMKSLEPLSANLDTARWQGAKFCLVSMLDQMSKQMLVPKVS